MKHETGAMVFGWRGALQRVCVWLVGLSGLSALGACTPPATQFIASERMRDAEPLALKG